MTIDGKTRVEGPVDLSAATIYGYFRGHAYPDEIERRIAAAYVEHTGAAGLRTSGVVGQSGVETGRHSYGGQVAAEQMNFAGLGATDDGAAGGFFGSPEEGVKRHVAHWGNYLYGPFDRWPERMKPYRRYAHRNQLVLDLMRGRTISTFGELGSGVWGTDSPYWPKVIAQANVLLAAEAAKGATVGKYPHVKMFLPSGVNHWDGRNGHVPDGQVAHVAEGTASGVKSWFNNPASEASTHVLILKSGERWQFLDYGDTAWANGKLNNPNLADPFIASYQAKNINPNRRTISFETERYWTERLTAQQIESIGELSADLHRQFGWPTDGSRVWGHNEFDSVDRARCPSFTRAEWQAAILDPIAGLTPIPATPPIDQPNDSSLLYDLTTGYYVDPLFWDFYSQAGGWTYFGRPIAGSAGYNDGALRQAFENVTLELPKGGAVKLASIGTAYKLATGQLYPVWPMALPQVA